MFIVRTDVLPSMATTRRQQQQQRGGRARSPTPTFRTMHSSRQSVHSVASTPAVHPHHNPQYPLPAIILNRRDLAESLEAYSTLLERAKQYRLAISALGKAAAEFGSATENVARLKAAQADRHDPYDSPDEAGGSVAPRIAAPMAQRRPPYTSSVSARGDELSRTTLIEGSVSDAIVKRFSSGLKSPVPRVGPSLSQRTAIDNRGSSDAVQDPSVAQLEDMRTLDEAIRNLRGREEKNEDQWLGQSLQAASGFHHLSSSLYGLMSDTIYKSFEIPLMESYDNFARSLQDAQTQYEQASQECGRRIAEIEKENMKRGKRKERDLSLFRSALAGLQLAVDQLDRLKADYYVEILQDSRHEIGQIVERFSWTLRSEIEVHERLAAKGSNDAVLEPLMTSIVDPFKVLEFPESSNETFGDARFVGLSTAGIGAGTSDCPAPSEELFSPTSTKDQLLLKSPPSRAEYASESATETETGGDVETQNSTTRTEDDSTSRVRDSEGPEGGTTDTDKSPPYGSMGAQRPSQRDGHSSRLEHKDGHDVWGQSEDEKEVAS